MIENVRMSSAGRYLCRAGHNIAAGFFQEVEGGSLRGRGKGEGKGKRNTDLVSFRTISIVRFHHFCHILLVTQTSAVTYSLGRGYTKV